MTEDQNEGGNKELEAMKVLARSRYPNEKDTIDLIKTHGEMTDFLHGMENETETETDETETETPKELGIVKHIHEIATKQKDDDEDDIDKGTVRGSGQDLSKTGGKVSLFPKRTSTDETEQAETPQEVIRAIEDELSALEFKMAFGKTDPKDRERYRVLKAKSNRLFRSLWLGHKAMRGKRDYGSAWKCPQCGELVIDSGICKTCGYIEDTPVNQDEVNKWKILRGGK